MSKALYRGCPYDTEDMKKEYQKWYLKTHAPSRSKNTYRGISYRPSKNMEIQK